jgi:hypothetical protein
MITIKVVKSPQAIEEDIATIQQQIAELQEQLTLLIEFRDKLKNKKSNKEVSQSVGVERLSMVDAIEKVIKDNKGSIHADNILKKIEEMGFKTSKASIVATISNYASRGERFIALGQNIFDLIENQKA